MPTLNKQVHLDALTQELTDDPSGLGLAGMTDKQAAQALTAPTQTPVVGVASSSDVARVLTERDKWQAVQVAADADTALGRTARGLYSLVMSPQVQELDASKTDGALIRSVNALVAGAVLDADDRSALRDAFTSNVAGPSRGRELGIGRIYWQFVWQARNPGVSLPWAAKFEGPGHALAFTDDSGQFITSQTINDGVEYLSAEEDLAANTIVAAIRYYFTVAGFAAAPDGNMLARVQPYYGTGGTAFDSFLYQTPFYVDADAQFDFTGWFPNQIARWIKFGLYNDSGQNTDASAVDAWLWWQEITA